jgi:hypothetical protein
MITNRAIPARPAIASPRVRFLRSRTKAARAYRSVRRECRFHVKRNSRLDERRDFLHRDRSP